MPGSVLSAMREIIFVLENLESGRKKRSCIPEIVTKRQHEECAKIGGKPWCTAEAKEQGLPLPTEAVQCEALRIKLMH